MPLDNNNKFDKSKLPSRYVSLGPDRRRRAVGNLRES